jgi:hypothetical protein
MPAPWLAGKLLAAQAVEANMAPQTISANKQQAIRTFMASASAQANVLSRNNFRRQTHAVDLLSIPAALQFGQVVIRQASQLRCRQATL